MSETPATPVKRYATARDYALLMKPGIMRLVVFTAFAGLIAAVGVTGTAINPVMAGIALLAVALGSGAASAINMWFDRDIDAIMTRTKTRPIPSGAVPADEAISLGLIMSGVSVLLMWLASNWFAAFMLGVSIIYYGVIYTMWLKRSTPQNIVIGGGAGAFPPLIGWAIVTGNAPLDAWILFAIIFFWTPPHFWALSLLAHGEYEKAGVPMLPVTHGAKRTRLEMLIYTIVLVPLSLTPVLTGLGGWIYAVVTSVLGAVFLWHAVRVFRSNAGDKNCTAEEKKLARSMFLFSILYLFVVFGAVIFEHATGLYFPVRGA